MSDEKLPVKWADSAQFWAQPIERGEDGFITPKVYLLSMNADPLGDVASMNMIYQGGVCRDLDELTGDDRLRHWDEVMATYLKAPLESVLFHFLIEGVDRNLTHQAVRQRTATYAQESLRFAVKGEPEFLHPPSIAMLPSDDPRRLDWESFVQDSHATYMRLAGDGIPSEDARSVLAPAIGTRYHYVVNLRNIASEAGSRLCTQAQFVWRFVFAGIVKAIREYEPIKMTPGAKMEMERMGYVDPSWQFETIADSLVFRPVCYQIGKCPWKGETDRPCSIRERVDIRAKHGAIDPAQWHKPFLYNGYTEKEGSVILTSEGIQPEEWLLDTEAARRGR